MPIRYTNRLKLFPPPATSWTDPVASVDTRRVYVAANGSNSNDGLTTGTPKLTIAAGKALLRPGFPDWLLLRQGDTFTNQSFGVWKDVSNNPLSGRSQTERMVIGSYNTGSPGARPIVQTGISDGFTWSTPGSGTIEFLYILGIAFNPHTYTGNESQAGIRITSNWNWVHIEDCFFNGCRQSINISNTGTSHGEELVIRRNVTVDSYASNTGQIANIRVDKTWLILIEENVVDNHQTSGTDVLCPSIFVAEICIAATIRNNIVTRANDRAITIECGGQVKDNVIVQSACGIQFGLDVAGAIPTIAAGVPVDAYGNLIIEGITGPLLDNARGFQFRNISGGTVQRNIITQTAGGSGVLPMYILGDGWRIRNLSISGNIIKSTGGAVRVNGTNATTQQISSCAFYNNDIQQQAGSPPVIIVQNTNTMAQWTSSGNRFWDTGSESSWCSMGGALGNVAFYRGFCGDSTSVSSNVSYTGGTYTIGTYHATVGGTATTAAFITACRAQSRLAWDDDLNASAILTYFRTGYGI